MNPSIGSYLTYGVIFMEFFTNLLRKLRLSKTRKMKEEPKTTDVPYEQDSIPASMKSWTDDGIPQATTWHRGYMCGVHHFHNKRTPPDDIQ